VHPRLPPSRLQVRVDSAWRTWWDSDLPPERWNDAGSTLADAMTWQSASAGVEWGELRLSGRGEAWRLRLVVVRMDPVRVVFSLDTAFAGRRERAAWSVEIPDSTVLVAVNAGQFPRTMPWGWVVMNGREFLRPGTGPLSTAFAVDSSGNVRWIPGPALDDPAVRRGVVTAFQSYPTLLSDDGRIPPALRQQGLGVDLEHRDARVAIGEDRRGRVIIALTRFDALDGALSFVPFGLTTPEMAAVMGGLGARDAVLLDGGISSQLLIRTPAGPRRWTGLRKVPLGLVVRARP